MQKSLIRSTWWLAVACIALVPLATFAQEGPAEQEETQVNSKVVTLTPDTVLTGKGENVDTIGVWEAPNPEDTLVFVSAKGNSLVEVWKYPFTDNEQEALQIEEFGTSNVNGVVIDQEKDLLYITVGDEVSSAFVFELPSLELKSQFVNASRELHGEPNCGLLKRPDGQTLVYVTSDNAISIHDAATGEQLDIVDQPTDVETVYADPYYQIVYVPDENDRTGVNVYTPDLKPYMKDGTNHFGTGAFEDDAEGVWVYASNGFGGSDDGSGYIIVSDQRSPLTDFEFFDRQTWEHLGTLRLEGVGNTDGLVSNQRPLPEYPLGFFAAINDDTSTAIIGWDKIIKGMGLEEEEREVAQEDSAAEGS